MSLLQRHIAPKTSEITKFEIIEAQTHQLSNGIKLFSIDAGTEEVIRIEWLIRAGASYQEKILTASTLSKILKEGTAKMNSSQINELLDFHGASLSASATAEHIVVVLYSLTKHLDTLLPLVKDILTNATLPENELSLAMQKSISLLNINNNKNSFVARNMLDKYIYGNHNPYGYYPEGDDFSKVKRANIVSYYNEQFTKQAWDIIASGKLSKSTLNLIKHTFKDVSFENIKPKRLKTEFSLHKQKQTLIKKPDSKQASIAIGMRTIKRNEPEYPGFSLLNTVLGGYFGSRLMQNIREDKGYTYGVYSVLKSMTMSGQWGIYTDVGIDVYESALNEIYIEIERLKKEHISLEELHLVKNYIAGTFLSSIDGPFALANKFKSIYLFDLDYSYFDRFLSDIKNITPKKLNALANKYLDNSYHQVVVA
ncbi:MAG TPA: insulinase family protein [Bacteroidetes bacterium]|nr:insulinase family protein [Bacteroidota bacterium]